MISRRFLRRLSRQYRENQQAWYLRPFAPLLGHPQYFAVNRKSVARALGLGVFVSMLPVPGHTVIAVILALMVGVNLGVAAVAAWFNTPLTMIPVFYFEYRLGALLLGTQIEPWPDDVSWVWLKLEFATVWPPLFLGALLVAALTALAVYFAVNLTWRWSSARRYRRREARSRVLKPGQTP